MNRKNSIAFDWSLVQPLYTSHYLVRNIAFLITDAILNEIIVILLSCDLYVRYLFVLRKCLSKFYKRELIFAIIYSQAYFSLMEFSQKSIGHCTLGIVSNDGKL